ncbi:RNA polymerase sigma factor [Rubrivirga sp.]|uniref:RNA polymerase sigma factor n=1 Tax=Rubrivirga sp. TaxID=1885344 RepID=UPI003B51D4B9
MPDDSALLRSARSGDPDAFRTLVVRYQGLVAHVVGRVVADPAEREDVGQEVFLQVHRRLDQFRGDAQLSTWVGRIAYHAALRHVRRRRPTPIGLGTDAPEPPGPDDSDAASEAEHRDRVLRAAIDSLPPAHRVALTLFHLDGLSHAQVAETLGLPLGTVKNTLFRARKRLKDLLLTATPREDWL